MRTTSARPATICEQHGVTLASRRSRMASLRIQSQALERALRFLGFPTCFAMPLSAADDGPMAGDSAFGVDYD